MANLKELNDFLHSNNGCFDFTIQAIKLLLQQILPNQTLSVTHGEVSLQPLRLDTSESDEGDQVSPGHVSPPQNAPDFVFPDAEVAPAVIPQQVEQIGVNPQIAEDHVFPPQDAQVAPVVIPQQVEQIAVNAQIAQDHVFLPQVAQVVVPQQVEQIAVNQQIAEDHVILQQVEQIAVLPQNAQDLQVAQPRRSERIAAGRARVIITQIIQDGGLRYVQNTFGGSARARVRARARGPALGGLGGGGIEVPFVGEQNIEPPPIVGEQNIEPPPIIEVPFAGEQNIEPPPIIEVPFVGVQNIEPLEVPVVGEQNIVDQDGDIVSSEDCEDDETPNLTGEIKELRVKLEATKIELSSFVLADSFWLTALEDILLEKLPFECEPLEENALKELLVEKFKTKWHSNPMLDFEYICQKMVSRGTGSNVVVLERSEGKAYFKLVEKELQLFEPHVYDNIRLLGVKLQLLTQDLEKLVER